MIVQREQKTTHDTQIQIKYSKSQTFDYIG